MTPSRAALELDNPLNVLRARILELEAEKALLEDANFYLMAERARLRYMPNTQPSDR